MWQYADILRMSLHEQLDIISKLKEIKQTSERVDAKAKGPTKLEVRRHCCREMENDVLRMQMAMSDNTLTMAIKMYHTKMKDIADQLPLEENDLTRQHDQAASLVRGLINDRLRGFDERALSGPKQIMEALTEYPEAQLTNANYNKSLKQCQDLTTEIIKQIRHSSDDLIPILNIERGGQLEKFDKLKEDGLKMYDAQAKGPGREAFRLICEEGIDGCLRPRKKYLLLSKVQLMN
ncbi:hypothetical protein BSL78_07052 [Apostichopus japonicus]|uniref:Uncharacterized protein n=1 Tax=Stichopus japonicus TaxID=307972 RepID=A0A2G8L6Y1_STIJA|nr:hypothetical protein BSL78_07052 [Apostichopus japonicus]